MKNFSSFLLNAWLGWLCFFGGVYGAQAAIWYVKPAASGLGDGSSWANASGNLNTVLAAATSGDEVWVALGTYKPSQNATNTSTGANDRTNTFRLKNGVKLYGGFAGTETALAQRATPTLNGTILSGDIGTVGNVSDNCYHVLLAVNSATTIVVNGVTIIGGKANSNTNTSVPKAVHNRNGSGLYSTHSVVSVANCFFVSNAADNAGGHILAHDTTAISIKNTQFTSGDAFSGGGVYVSNGSISAIDSCDFSSNNATYGAALYIGTTTTANTLQNSTLSGNTGVVGSVCLTTGTKLAATGCTFSNNQITFAASIVTIGSASGSLITLQLLRCTFQNNTASNSGGAIYTQYGTSVSMDSCAFSGNSAVYVGGAVVNNTCTYTVSNCTFTNNTCNSVGGGWYSATGTNTFTACTFAGNTAVNVGGFDGSRQTTTTQYNQCLFRNNTAPSGGAVHMDASGVTFNKCVFEGNTAQMGSVYFHQNGGAGAVFQNCVMANNSTTSASARGGAIYTKQTGSSATLKNCTLYGCATASAAGSTTFCADTSSSISVENTIAYHAIGTAQPAIATAAGGAVSLSYVLVEGGYTGTGVISSDPKFKDTADPDGADNTWLTADDGLSLTQCSPAIDAANDATALTQDALGNSRMDNVAAVGGVGDIGAYEFQTTYAHPSSAVLTGSSMVCLGNDGYLQVAITGGTPPYFVDAGYLGYNYHSGDSILVFQPTNTFTVSLNSVTDAFGCEAISKTGTVTTVVNPKRYYVNQNAVGSPETGAYWATAFTNLGNALAASYGNSCLHEIWVAQGTYKPSRDAFGDASPADNRDKTFYVKDSVRLVGGFIGSEMLENQSNPKMFPTILSGDLAGDDVDFTNMSENVYHVVISANTPNGVALRGLTITGGNADSGTNYSLNGQNISNLNGAGYYAIEGKVSMQECTVERNVAAANGGGLYLQSNTSPMLTNCLFAQDTASWGGGVFAQNFCLPTLINCTLGANYANQQGSALYNQQFSPFVLKNSIVWGNTGTPTPIFDEVIPSLLYYTTIEGGAMGIGNSSADPLFANLADPNGADNLWANFDDGLRLQCASPAINGGDNAELLPTMLFDLIEDTRIRFSTVDRGAYEHWFGVASNTPALSLPGHVLTAHAECTTADGWTHYYDVIDELLLLSLKKNGQNIGTLDDGIFTVEIGAPESPSAPQNLSSAGYASALGGSSWWVMNRYWNVTPTTPPTDSIGVRFYYQTADYNEVNTAAGGSMVAETNMRFYKLIGAKPFPWSDQLALAPAALHLYTHDTAPSKTHWNRGTTALGTPYAEFYVTSFFGRGRR